MEANRLIIHSLRYPAPSDIIIYMKKALVLLLSLCILLNGSYITGAGSPAAAGSSPSGPSDDVTTVIVTLREGCDAPELTADRTSISFQDDSFIILDYYGNDEELDAYLYDVSLLPGVLSAERDTVGCLTAASGPQTDDYFAATHQPPIVAVVDGRYVVSKPLATSVQPQLASNYTLTEAK